MLKNILNLKGAQELSNNEQKSINGGVTKQCVDNAAANLEAGCAQIYGTCPDGSQSAAALGCPNFPAFHYCC